MNLIITPYEGVGPIEFGMTRNELRKLFNGEVHEIQRIRDTDNIWDYIHEGAIQIAYYSEHRLLCSTIMLSHPEQVFFQDRNLLDGTSVRELTKWFKSIDKELDITMDGVVSYKYGISFCTEDYKILADEPPEAIVVFARGFHKFIPTEESYSKKISWEDAMKPHPEDCDYL